MTDINSVLRKVAEKAELSPGEMRALLQLGRVHDIMSAWGMDERPNFSRGFRGAPKTHQAALLLCCGGVDAQTIPSGWWTEVDFKFDGGGTWDSGGDLYIEDGHVAGGDDIDKIWAPGISYLLFTMECYWEGLSTVGVRAMRWLAGDGSVATYYMNPTPAGDAGWSDVHRRRQVAPLDYYHMQVYQNSGGNLDLGFLNFVAWRIT